MKDEMIPMEALIRAPENIPLRTVAVTAYEAVRAYAKDCGDNHHRRWGGLDREHQDRLVEGALFHILNYRNGTTVDAEAAHLHRCKQLFQAGWKYGPLKDVEGKLTPLLVEWENLLPRQRHYYRIFCAIALNLGMYVDESELPGLVVVAADTLSQIVGADVALHVGVGGAAPQGELGPSSESSTDSSSSDSEKSETPSSETSSDTESQSTETESASTPETSSSSTEPTPTTEDSVQAAE